MIPDDRRNEIIGLLNRNGFMSVEELAQAVYASVPTIRRDLKSLQEEGSIKRVHGGATRIDSNRTEYPFHLRNKSHSQEKQIIGRLAASLLKDGDHIFIDTGSTCYAMVGALKPDISLTVLTNCIPTLQALSQKNLITLECPCGEYNRLHGSITGEDAAHFISTRSAHFYFASATGLSLDNGVNTLTQMDLPVKRAMQKNAESTVLLMDHSKMNQSHYYKAFDISDVHIIISDRKLPDNIVEKCKKENIRVVTPD